MPNRALKVGDVVAIRPSAVAALKREGYQNVPLHVPAKIIDDWASSITRRVFRLDIDGKHERSGVLGIDVWPSQVRLYSGAEEVLYRRCLALQAKIDAMRAERRAAKKQRKKGK